MPPGSEQEEKTGELDPNRTKTTWGVFRNTTAGINKEEESNKIHTSVSLTFKNKSIKTINKKEILSDGLNVNVHPVSGFSPFLLPTWCYFSLFVNPNVRLIQETGAMFVFCNFYTSQ